MEAYPKPRHQYIYTPRYGQRGILSYAGQAPNGAAPTGIIGGAYAYGFGYPAAAACQPVRSYYNTVPTYGYTAHVYPPGHATTTTTTYHVTNAQAPLYASPTAQLLRETRPAYAHGHAYTPQAPTREEIQLENRRIATQRGAYDARKIRPADARDDDPFWCREVNGEWHLRSYYQIENECHPGRWMMDAEIGFLVFHRA